MFVKVCRLLVSQHCLMADQQQFAVAGPSADSAVVIPIHDAIIGEQQLMNSMVADTSSETNID